MRRASIKTISIILLLLSLATVASAAKWYEGGTLHQASIGEWWQASQQNRLATCGDLIAHMHLKGYLNLPITTVESIKPYAIELVSFISAATKDLDDVKLNKVAEFAAIGMGMMGWTK